MEAYSWTCPFCDKPTTITDRDTHHRGDYFKIDNSDGYRYWEYIFIVCPNPECKKFSFYIKLFNLVWNGENGHGQYEIEELLEEWQLIPPSNAKTFPDYIPKPILEDYKEACLIMNLSPKASATLSRRCLQGIIRDYWKAKPGRLVDEIDEIKDKIDPLTWKGVNTFFS